MTRRQNACASTLRVSSVSSHLPGNMSNTRVAARSPTPRRLYLRRTKNSLISRVPSPAKCAPSRINTKPASLPPTRTRNDRRLGSVQKPSMSAAVP